MSSDKESFVLHLTNSDGDTEKLTFSRSVPHRDLDARRRLHDADADEHDARRRLNDADAGEMYRQIMSMPDSVGGDLRERARETVRRKNP